MCVFRLCTDRQPWYIKMKHESHLALVHEQRRRDAALATVPALAAVGVLALPPPRLVELRLGAVGSTPWNALPAHGGPLPSDLFAVRPLELVKRK